jgi:UDP-N-acetylglucosamine 2-epimerase (non-hydrolysing)
MDMLVLMEKAEFILTDSGGLQEEATAPSIRKPVILLRTSTERPEAVQAGFTVLVSLIRERILAAADALLNEFPPLPNSSPFGDGHASQRIARNITSELPSISA